MNKLELAIRSVEWKIERIEKEYNEAREALTRDLASGGPSIFNPTFVKSYADRMDCAYKALANLHEQLNTLKHLAE